MTHFPSFRVVSFGFACEDWYFASNRKMQNKTHCFASKPMEFRFRFVISFSSCGKYQHETWKTALLRRDDFNQNFRKGGRGIWRIIPGWKILCWSPQPWQCGAVCIFQLGVQEIPISDIMKYEILAKPPYTSRNYNSQILLNFACTNFAKHLRIKNNFAKLQIILRFR